jgi:choline dehydrogenase
VRHDYVIVGGGTAGCVLASRLSEDPEVRVLLLEAGPDTGPTAVAHPIGWGMLWGTQIDWASQTVPQTRAGGRISAWPHGKVLGGSSAINGTIHCRGNQDSYDAWAAAGATGWDYASMLPFLKRIENAVDHPGSSYRGADGPMIVSRAAATRPLWDAAFEAAVEAGHPAADDLNDGMSEGVGWPEHNVVNGARQTAADAYLTPVRHRSNLDVLTGAQARRLLLDSGCCRGVEYVMDGQLRPALAEREVVLTAGAVGSPRLLLLSGIGPARHLREVGIDVVADRPGAGENLHDHLLCPVAYELTSPHAIDFSRKPHVRFRSDPAGPVDFHLLFVPISSGTTGVANKLNLMFGLMQPFSRGSIRLNGADPEGTPLIDPNYLADDRDVERMVVALQRAREVAEATALSPWRGREISLGPDVRDDVACGDYIRQNATTFYHPVGTCRIGVDDKAVVNPELRVHGVESLRVADASVMPSIVSANTNATTLAIAERAAVLISGRCSPGVPGV